MVTAGAVFQDVSLYHAQFDHVPWSSAFIQPVEDEVAAALLIPDDDDLATIDEVVGSDLILLAHILSGFLDGSIGGGVVRNKFLCVKELTRAVSLVMDGGDLGTLGAHGGLQTVSGSPLRLQRSLAQGRTASAS